MKRHPDRNFGAFLVATLGLCLLAAGPGWASLGVEIWTDRGDGQVYRSGDRMEVRARTSTDVHLLVYELDAEGRVRLLYPYDESDDFVSGRETHVLPPRNSDIELVVDSPVGQGYLVAIASYDEFAELPWYLRPYDETGAAAAYAGEIDEEDGITAEGRVVGDPFVAMERIRRAVLQDPDDPGTFATSYTTYYTHEKVHYPRYLCYDCHRPNQWAWWDGFDPYYTSCSVFTVSINSGWYWGPTYWFGYVPYYYYAYRPDCPPHYRRSRHAWYSSWDGWSGWCALWGGPLTRIKSRAPRDYISPTRYKERGGVWANGRTKPPGFMTVHGRRGVERIAARMPIGRQNEERQIDRRSRRDFESRRGTVLEGGGRRLARPEPMVRSRDREEGSRRGVTVRRSAERIPVGRENPGRWSPRRPESDAPTTVLRSAPRGRDGFGRGYEGRGEGAPSRHDERVRTYSERRVSRSDRGGMSRSDRGGMSRSDRGGMSRSDRGGVARSDRGAYERRAERSERERPREWSAPKRDDPPPKHVHREEPRIKSNDSGSGPSHREGRDSGGRSGSKGRRGN